jgi:hypothetical protein
MKMSGENLGQRTRIIRQRRCQLKEAQLAISVGVKPFKLIQHSALLSHEGSSRSQGAGLLPPENRTIPRVRALTTRRRGRCGVGGAE